MKWLKAVLFSFVLPGLVAVVILFWPRVSRTVKAVMAHPPSAAAATAPVPQLFANVSGLPDRGEVLALLHARRFDELEHRLGDSTRRQAEDPDAEWRAAAAFSAFETSDSTQLSYLNEWVKHSPTSALPLLARAIHYTTSGYEARGTGVLSRVSQAQRDQMIGLHGQARVDAEQAIFRDRTLVDAHIVLIAIAQARGQSETCEILTQQALQVLPASFRVRASCMNCLRPRWGGSYDRMQAIAFTAQSHADANPRLRALLGMVEYDAGTQETGDVAVALLGHALSHGDYYRFYAARARVFDEHNQLERALAEYDLALQRAPFDADLLLEKARVLGKAGRVTEAMAVLEQVAKFGVIGSDYERLASTVMQHAVVIGAQRVKAKDTSGAHEVLDAILAVEPAHVEALYWNGRAYLAEQDFKGALDMFRRGVAADPGNFDHCQNLDYVLASSSRWNDIVSMWSNYLVLHPQDGRAWFERAGAYRHYDQNSAYADVRRACELGVAEACRVPVP